MTISRAYKYRLYPRRAQLPMLSQHFGAARFIYNHFLDLRETSYKSGTKLSGFACKRMLPSLKQAYPWLKEINSQSLQQAVINLELGYRRFFKGLGDHPTFKKKRGRQSFSVPQRFTIKGNYLYIPNLDTGLRVKLHRPIGGKIKSLTISRSSSGKYFVSFTVEQEIRVPEPELFFDPTNTNALDLGLINFTTSSTGEKVESSRFLRKALDKIAKLNRELSRKQKGSKNWNKACRKLTCAHEHVANQRSNFIHHQSRKAVDDSQVLCLEDLCVKGMMMYGNLGLSVSDAGLGEFVRQAQYKSLWAGKRVIQIGRFFPSSKTCSSCWAVYSGLELKDRNWACPNCGAVHDRDINAAKVIGMVGSKLGQDLPEVKPVERRTAVLSMKGMQSRRGEYKSCSLGPSVKQEAKVSRGLGRSYSGL